MNILDIESLTDKKVVSQSIMSNETIYHYPDAGKFIENRMIENISEFIIKNNILNIDVKINEQLGGLKYTGEFYILKPDEMQRVINEIVWKTLSSSRMPFHYVNRN